MDPRTSRPKDREGINVGTNEAGCGGCRFNLAIFISPFFVGLLQRPLEVIEALQERLKNYKGKDGEPVNRDIFPKLIFWCSKDVANKQLVIGGVHHKNLVT